MAKQANEDAEDASKTVKITLVKSPIGFNRSQGKVVAEHGPAQDPTTRWS